MAEPVHLLNQTVTSGGKKYVTEHRWILNDWDLLYDSTYMHGIQSGEFKLNGTDSTYQLFLEPMGDDSSYLAIEFSDTWDILHLEVMCRCQNRVTDFYVNSRPIEKRASLTLLGLLSKNGMNYIFKGELEPDEKVTLAVTITIMKSVATNKFSRQIVNRLTEKAQSLPSNFSANFKSLFDRKSLCDVTFLVGDEKLPAHKTVLAAQSRVFEALFGTTMKEREENVVNVVDTKVEVFKEFLKYMYTGQVTDLHSMVEEMLVVADFYQVDFLKLMCEECMLRNLCENNAVRYSIIGDQLACKDLKNEALNLIRNSPMVFEKLVVEANPETIMCLRQILLHNPEKTQFSKLNIKS